MVTTLTEFRPENIFGSLQVSGDGQIDGDGGYQPSGQWP